MNNIKIGFWKKESGNLMSIGKGLSQAEIDFLRSLKPGDRLILWDNSRSKGNNDALPGFSLAKYEKGNNNG